MLGKGVTNLRIINMLTYIILNNYLENINLQKYFIYIHRSGIYNVPYIYYEFHLFVLLGIYIHRSGIYNVLYIYIMSSIYLCF